MVKSSERPGLGRRIVLLGACYGAHWARERGEWRLQRLVHHAYEAPQNTQDKAFWRRVGSLTHWHDSWDRSAVAWRATARNAIADMVANQPIEYEQAARSMRNIEYSVTTKGGEFVVSPGASQGRSHPCKQIGGIYSIMSIHCCYPAIWNPARPGC